jgi:hypothetical protein
LPVPAATAIAATEPSSMAGRTMLSSRLPHDVAELNVLSPKALAH